MGHFFKAAKKESKKKERLVIITGCAGSGKTTIGKELAKSLGYAYVDKDTVTREFTDFILTKLGSFEGDRESSLYRENILPIEYKVTFKVCREILESGGSVVVTIPFISQIQNIDHWEAIKRAVRIKDKTDVKFVWIKHDIDSEKKNIQKRDAARDAYKLSHWDEYARSVDGVKPASEYNAYIYVNDCNISLYNTLEDLKEWLEK